MATSEITGETNGLGTDSLGTDCLGTGMVYPVVWFRNPVGSQGLQILSLATHGTSRECKS